MTSLHAAAIFATLLAMFSGPAARAATITVGQAVTPFNYGWNPLVDMMQWASAARIGVGDTLVFSYPAFMDEVWAFPSQQAMATCNYNLARRVCDDQMGAAGCLVHLNQEGVLFFASGMMGFCRRSLRMMINVQNNYQPRQLVVGAPSGAYNYPWNPLVNFNKWGAANPAYIGDSLVFQYPAFTNDVYMVATQQEFDACDYNNYVAFCKADGGTGQGCVSAPLTAQPMYFLSGNYPACLGGQKIVVAAQPPP